LAKELAPSTASLTQYDSFFALTIEISVIRRGALFEGFGLGYRPTYPSNEGWPPSPNGLTTPDPAAKLLP
jgi:hypothetical protein